MNSDEKYDIILKIRSTRGSNAKKNLLSAYPELQGILMLTYDPFKRFYMEVPNNYLARVHGEEQFSATTNGLLNSLINQPSTLVKKQAVNAHMSALTYKSAALLGLIINKSMDFGLGAKSINEVWPGLIPQHPIQLAKPFELRKCSFPCYVSPKIDGLRAIFKDGKFYSRNGHQFKGLEVLEYQIQTYAGLDIILDGELTVVGEHFNEISGKIRDFKSTDNAIYNVFDLPSLTERTFEERNIAMLNVAHAWRSIPEPVNFEMILHRRVEFHEQLLYFHKQFLDEGYEGTMVKQIHGMYRDSRSWDWMKIKTAYTLDLPVIGLFEGDGKYYGQCGGLIVNFQGKAVRVGSGLTDKQRAYWWEDPELIIGQTVEVAYQEVTPDQSLRHPRLKTVRGDK